MAAVAATGLCIVTVAAGSAIGGGKPSTSVNPDLGLSERQVIVRQSDALASFQIRLDNWFASLDVARLDLTGLPRHERLLTLDSPAATLDQAVAEARIVAVGTVASIAPSVNGTVVTLRVESVLKGRASGHTIAFMQAATPRPTDDWSGAYIADSPGALLYVGGAVLAGPLNPFAGTVNGKAPAPVAAATAATVHQQGP